MGRSRCTSQSGFTLVELLLVVAVLGLLAMVAVVAVPGLADDARARSCAADRDALATAESAHTIQHGAPVGEAELVSEGLLSSASELHDIELVGDSYELVGVGECAEDADDSGSNVLTGWLGLLQPATFGFGPDGRISVSGSGERQAIAESESFTNGVIEVAGARTTKGNGWGVVFHAGDNGRGQISGYVFQMDTGYAGGRFVLRQRDGGESAPLAVRSPLPGFDWRAPHDVRLELTGTSLVASIDGATVMEVADLAAAGRAVGSRYAPRSEGSVGLRLWSTSDLEVESIEVTRR